VTASTPIRPRQPNTPDDSFPSSGVSLNLGRCCLIAAAASFFIQADPAYTFAGLLGMLIFRREMA